MDAKRRSERGKGAVSLWEAVLARDPEHGPALVALAKIWEHRLGDPERAMMLTRWALSCYRDDREAQVLTRLRRRLEKKRPKS